MIIIKGEGLGPAAGLEINNPLKKAIEQVTNSSLVLELQGRQCRINTLFHIRIGIEKEYHVGICLTIFMQRYQ